MPMQRSFVRIVSSAVVLAAIGCSSGPTDRTSSSTSQAMSSTIHSVYGLTSFGGQGDCQSVACGGSNSCDSQPWYSASSQRYGCGVHLQVQANGSCVVVATLDAGPASWVESDAGIAILDASPAVAQYLFGVSSLGWSDIKNNPGTYEVDVQVTQLPLGPCDGSGSSSGGSSGTGSSGGSSGSSSGSSGGSSGGSSSGGSSSGGAACASDGDCNPGTDGSGQICVQGTCVDGCNADWECPGSESCVSGQCQ
jgi:hypothetical protein